jgi:SAM-dependent methyltransferase
MTKGFAELARSRHGIEVECAPVETADSLNGEYDVILLDAILEHLYDPAETLKRVKRALRPGGLVFIDVPNECSMMTRIGNAYLRLQRKDWAVNLSPTFPPFHVVGFCPASLNRLLDRTGFRIIDLRLHRWNVLLPPAEKIRAKIEGVGLNLVLSVGQFMGMGAGLTCWAVKR